jgi:hypothetical protein
MQTFVVETDDRALALARAGEVLSSSPAVVADGSAASAAGTEAWAAVRRLPTATSTRHLASVLREAQPTARALSLTAAELARRLREHPPQPAERVWIAAPAVAQPAGLGALLAIARHLSFPVDGFVDAAVASVSVLDIGGAAIVIELGLHHAAATLIEREGGSARRRRAVLSERPGETDALRCTARCGERAAAVRSAAGAGERRRRERGGRGGAEQRGQAHRAAAHARPAGAGRAAAMARDCAAAA